MKKVLNEENPKKSIEYEDLEKLFDKIENLKKFQEWFGKPCPEFQPLCWNCDFWNKWEKFKLDIFKDIF